MVCAELVMLLNAAMCLTALPLGGRLAGLPVPGGRALALSAALGALTALGAAYLPALSPLMLLSLPIAVLICFRSHGLPACLRCGVTTLGASFLTGGAATALVGGGLRPTAAVALGACLSWLCYLLVTLLPSALCEVRQVELRVGENAVLLPAMLDSGNLLRDPVTGMPVLVVPRRAAAALFPETPDLCDLRGLPLGFRLLSVHTAAGSSLLPLFKPDLCRLYLNGDACMADHLLVAVAGREYDGVQALVPMAALPRQATQS